MGAFVHKNQNENPLNEAETALDEVAIYSPALSRHLLLNDAFNALTGELTGAEPLTINEQLVYLDQIKKHLLHTDYEQISTSLNQFVQTYEANNLPLFTSDNRISEGSLSVPAQALLVTQQWIQQQWFVEGRLNEVAGIAFEAAEAFSWGCFSF